MSKRAGVVVDDASLAALALSRAPFVIVRGAFSSDECERWSSAVLAARGDWTAGFDGEQFSLGRAFYTHYEEQRSGAYFSSAADSDALVERHLPGLQAAMRDALARVTGGHVGRRRGFCGPGVHIFPSGEKVSRVGGVVHFDVEGLTSHHLAHALPALTAVLMLQPAESGGGLRVWEARYAGDDEPEPAMLAAASSIASYEGGDLLLIDSYRLHQIQPFAGRRDRISATVHAAEISRGLWETWF